MLDEDNSNNRNTGNPRADSADAGVDAQDASSEATSAQSDSPANADDSSGGATAAPRRRRRAASRPAGAPAELKAAFTAPPSDSPAASAQPEQVKPKAAPSVTAAALFQPPPEVPALPAKEKRQPTQRRGGDDEASGGSESRDDDRQTRGNGSDPTDGGESDDSASDRRGDQDGRQDEGDGQPKRRRRRGGRRRKKPVGDGDSNDESGSDGSDDTTSDARSSARDDSDADSENRGGADDSGDNGSGDDSDGPDSGSGSGNTRRRRRRRRSGAGSGSGNDDPPNTVTHVRSGRDAADQVTSVRGSTRLEAKKQRRREGREAGRRRAPILTEAEFLARRESVERVMVVRQQAERTQIAVLEDNVLAEHYVNRSASTSMVGNVYLGRVQNVLPSMEAAFVDIGRGRNAVLYAGEVNWDAAGLEGQPKRIELALKSGDPVLVQVTKDPVGHKGARLTSQISLPGRFLVYVPGGSMTGISRRLPDKERARLKRLLRDALPEGSGVIVRTAAEGATEEQINHDVERLTAQWDALQEKVDKVKAPELLHGEPDLATRVVRDTFNEDFAKLIVSGDRATSTIEEYVAAVAPDLSDRVQRWAKNEDVFKAHRIDEQLTKALDRKVWLPSGGSLVIDHTEAMTVVDVNTGKFTGQGGNLEETVTRNNLEAAEEVVRQLRLRDVGGIIVIDFIDMVLESNRDLVLRRLTECLGRDRTKHQVAEVTSLGLVQMTRKRVGQGLLETFSEPCDCCNGRGVKVSTDPVDRVESEAPAPRRRRRPAGPIPGAPIASKADSLAEPESGTSTVVDPADESDEESMDAPNESSKVASESALGDDQGMNDQNSEQSRNLDSVDGSDASNDSDAVDGANLVDEADDSADSASADEGALAESDDVDAPNLVDDSDGPSRMQD